MVAVCEAYLKREAPKLRTADQRVRLLGRHVYPALGDRPISSVRRGEIVRLLDKVEDGSGSRTADVVLSILRRVFNWHAIRDDTFVPPIVRGMGRHGTAQHARSRMLNDEELGRVWRTAADAGAFGAMLRFLLLTGARRGEAGGITWDEVEDGVWSLPPSRNKTGQPLVRPLSKAARAVVDAQPHIVGVPYVFTAGQRPLTSISRMKKQFDAQCGVTGWTVHDVRRTARSLLSRAGISVDVAERCLGHVIGGVRGTYDRHQYQAEMLHAYEALASVIQRIVAPRRQHCAAAVAKASSPTIESFRRPAFQYIGEMAFGFGRPDAAPACCSRGSLSVAASIRKEHPIAEASFCENTDAAT